MYIAQAATGTMFVRVIVTLPVHTALLLLYFAAAAAACSL
jgi:hypothetical protein